MLTDANNEWVIYNCAPSGVVTITINRPEKRNALSTEVLQALIAAFKQAQKEPRAHVIILTGGGDKAFSAGFDLERVLAERNSGEAVQSRSLVELLNVMGKSPLPIIARVNGHCLAGAFGIALACDLIISVEEATFGTPEILIGLWPMMIGALIYRNLPRKVANELILTGKKISAQQAKAYGVINDVVPRNELDTKIAELTAHLCKQSPAIIAQGRQALFAQMDKPYLEALDFLEGALRRVMATDDAREGMEAFLAKRTPQFQGK